MLIQKEQFIAFKDFCRKYFKEEREARSTEVLQSLQVYDRKLFKAIEKIVGKQKMKGYIGRLLRSVGIEGWLIYERKTWKVKPEWGYCTYCLSPLEDVYLIDIDHHQYCNSDCFEELEAVSHYDAYEDDYLFLFFEFESLKDSYRYYLERPIQKDFETHLELMMILKDIYNVINDSEFSTVLFNGGDDGPLASEMYRMLIVLENDAEKLEKLVEQCKKKLPKSNKRYSIEIRDTIMRKRKRPDVLREFILKHRKYRDKTNKNKWFTSDSTQRSNWYDLLREDASLEDKVFSINEVECPACKQIIEEKRSRRAPDGYSYCWDCYNGLDSRFDISRKVF